MAAAGTLVAGVVVGAPSVPAGTVGAAQAGANPLAGSRVVVQRTAFGIPHVLAASYRDVGFGVGYAIAEDNLCGLADDILTVSGQRAQFLGADATTPEGVNNLDSDIYHAAVNRSGVLEAALAQPERRGHGPGGLDPNGHYPDVAFGTSFLMATQLTAAGPRTRTLLLYSESGNPASPHFLDQTKLYAAGQWVTERFTREEIATDPALRVEVLDPR